MQHYNPATDEWETTYSNNGGWWHDSNYGVVIPSRRIMYITGQGRSEVYNIDTRSYESITTSGDTEIEDAIAPGVAYDPVSDAVVAWTSGSDVYQLNLDTLVWTRVAAHVDNSVAPGASSRTYGRFQYSSSLDAFVLVNNVDENVYLYRLER